MNATNIRILEQLFNNGVRQFKIPVYQRNYVWSEKECNRLFDDITNLVNEYNKEHFMGTIIYFYSEDSTSNLRTEILVDGQQRLSTIMLLLKAIQQIAIEENDQYLLISINEYLYNKNQTNSSKIKVKSFNAKDTDFENIILSDYVNIDKHKESIYLNNFILFKNRIKKLVSNERIKLKDLLDAVKKLSGVEITLSEKFGDNPQAIFESINSTGKPLKEYEKIKNYLLMVSNQEYLYEKYWREIEDNLGEAIDNFFSDFLNLNLREFVNYKNIYDRFKEYKTKNNISNENLLFNLREISTIYSYFIQINQHHNLIINKKLKDLIILDQSTIYLFLIPIFQDLNKKTISESEVENILSFLVNYTLRRILCEIPSNRLKDLYKRLYNKLTKNGLEKEKIYDKLVSYLNQLNTDDKFPNDKNFSEQLIKQNIYNKKNVCKFILDSIENDNKEIILIENLNIEHILPQAKKDNWVKHLGKEYDNVYNNYLHTLGNLTLTAYNPELGTKSFDEKKKILENSKMKIINLPIINSQVWNENAILNRAKYLSDKLIDIFKEVKPKESYNFVEKDTQFSFNDYQFATGKKPISFTFNGEKIPVSSFAEIQKIFLQKLFEYDSEILLKIANSEIKLEETGKRMLATKSKEISRSKKLEEYEIYYDSNLSASLIIKYCYKLLQFYDFNEQEFGFELANN